MTNTDDLPDYILKMVVVDTQAEMGIQQLGDELPKFISCFTSCRTTAESLTGTLELVIPYPGNFQLGDILEVTVTNKGLE